MTGRNVPTPPSAVVLTASVFARRHGIGPPSAGRCEIVRRLGWGNRRFISAQSLTALSPDVLVAAGRDDWHFRY
jgi:hypothetical protein